MLGHPRKDREFVELVTILLVSILIMVLIAYGKS